MALTSRRLQREEEEESVFISMSDLMISILFIVMLVLAYFATLLIENTPEIRKLQQQVETLQAEIEELRKKLKADPLETALKGISEDRNLLLSRIEDRLIAVGIKVIVDEVSGVVRFGEEAIQFRSGSSSPDRQTAATMQKIAEILSEELTCYTLGENSTITSSECSPNNSIIEAVQIEGHTDSDGADIFNLNLSTRRATSTYEVFIKHRSELTNYLNANYLLDQVQGVDFVGEEVLSVSGYGETRPINFGTTQADKNANRRIDIRFIMTTPKNVEEVERLKTTIKEAVKTQGAPE